MAVGGAGFAQDPCGFFDLGLLVGGELGELFVHLFGDFGVCVDLVGEVAGDEAGGVQRVSGLAVGAQLVEVFFDGGQLGGVGAIEAAAGALEAQRAALAAGFDVGRLGAVAVGNGHGSCLVGGGRGHGRWMTGAIDHV
ncbi:hypothetical protein ROS62_23300 [Streptomyces sp. DSM 41972]|uniref:Uncharacterized protein n=1 Tax=Streptomyces althioticus subsp. attaecolombicae TaxID=3075534 RepID=A0ABU3I3Y0_9ACTN|nr:hypothetical protein [Streptomyces sp. DSM 41972]